MLKLLKHWKCVTRLSDQRTALLFSTPGCWNTAGCMFCCGFLFIYSFLTISVWPIISRSTGPIFAKFSGLGRCHGNQYLLVSCTENACTDSFERFHYFDLSDSKVYLLNFLLYALTVGTSCRRTFKYFEHEKSHQTFVYWQLRGSNLTSLCKSPDISRVTIKFLPRDAIHPRY